ncbi:MAG: response regulator [Phycisphaerae bacterium]|nr:response regulator [Phycisphaerae bacterium]
MAKVLVVDDEAIFRRQVELGLRPDGHQIATAASGREAIDIGARFRPDVVLTDWMLRDDIHGLHVAHVLRAVFPEMQVILMTGFPSDHLRSEAAGVPTCGFLEKPFKLEKIQAAISAATTAAASAKPRRSLLAVLEVVVDGRILFANSGAQVLLAETQAGVAASHMTELFGAQIPNLDAAIDRWVVAHPIGTGPARWYLRSQEPVDGRSRLVLLRHQRESRTTSLALIEMLLGFRDYEHARWPFDGRVLIVDSDAMNRRWFISLLESVGAGCYAVESLEHALDLLRNDADLEFVLLDLDGSQADPAWMVASIREVASRVTIVASSLRNRMEECASLGIPHFIEKPWRIDDLINRLSGRIGNCAECGLPLPLRWPREGDVVGSWECAACGTIYSAVFDHGAASGMSLNARAITA